MSKQIIKIAMAVAIIALLSIVLPGCAKSGDENAATADSEPEFTITGEAI
ncbi:hypothetical protein [Turneriella parva]|uniref:Uncharacterized protein n=1 Tax=Turneriella parva (strain ATCC BAA-1111 / DSM 21527 / NCTC 11395 / H) TaxID=869212 RepID=I4B0U8_TURPD|nr:hypothetical protein [Turneriella parva]AFM10905.1 hypothetical protein Turpa_0245 [Turneriella parva DSM 21527]